eukprot:GHVL01023672.1.p1 GENE.GHVL01023672.1~~GHVL01023672.1.p1  ORF type:complete len:180 (+),score=8.48 GHVL01023672.1:109-648(+)
MMSSDEHTRPPFPVRLRRSLKRIIVSYLDKSTPYVTVRWMILLTLAIGYVLRVWMLEGFYVVSYALGIFILNLFVGFLSPLVDPDTEEDLLPTKEGDDYRPFQRRLPEFKFWSSATTAFIISLLLTCSNIFDVPVFWPILLIYFLGLFLFTMRTQIKHMLKHKYVPFSFGKKTYSKSGG